MLLSLLVWEIGVENGLQKLEVIEFRYKEIKIEGLKDMNLKFDQLNIINPAPNLKGLIIIVDFIMKLGGQQQTSQEQLVHIAPSKHKILTIQIVPINVDQGNDQALRLEVGLEMNAVDVGLEVDVQQDARVER